MDVRPVSFRGVKYCILQVETTLRLKQQLAILVFVSLLIRLVWVSFSIFPILFTATIYRAPVIHFYFLILISWQEKVLYRVLENFRQNNYYCQVLVKNKWVNRVRIQEYSKLLPLTRCEIRIFFGGDLDTEKWIDGKTSLCLFLRSSIYGQR